MNRGYPERDEGEGLFREDSINGKVIMFMYIERLSFAAFAMFINLMAYDIEHFPLNLV